MLHTTKNLGWEGFRPPPRVFLRKNVIRWGLRDVFTQGCENEGFIRVLILGRVVWGAYRSSNLGMRCFGLVAGGGDYFCKVRSHWGNVGMLALVGQEITLRLGVGG